MTEDRISFTDFLEHVENLRSTSEVVAQRVRELALIVQNGKAVNPPMLRVTRIRLNQEMLNRMHNGFKTTDPFNVHDIANQKAVQVYESALLALTQVHGITVHEIYQYDLANVAQVILSDPSKRHQLEIDLWKEYTKYEAGYILDKFYHDQYFAVFYVNQGLDRDEYTISMKESLYAFTQWIRAVQALYCHLVTMPDFPSVYQNPIYVCDTDRMAACEQVLGMLYQHTHVAETIANPL